MDSCGVVIDCGSFNTRAGFGDNGAPTVVFPTLVGRKPISRFHVPGEGVQAFVGLAAWERRCMLNVCYPIERGAVTNWDDMGRVWQHAFHDHLRVNPREHSVVLSEALFASKMEREKMFQILFETFEVPSATAITRPVLASFGHGLLSSAMVASGFGASYVVPIFEGKVLRKSIVRTDVAGSDLTDYMVNMINERGHAFGFLEVRCLQDFKEKHCYVARDFAQECAMRPTEKSYELPDGQVITVGDELIRCPEALFQPYMLGVDAPGVHEAVFNSITSCDETVRKELWKNVALSGGSTMFGGFADRLQKELVALAPSDEEIKLVGVSPAKNTAWIGGSMVASMDCFRNYYVSRMAYEESGPSAVHQVLQS